LDLYARGEPLDAVMLGEELRRRGDLDEFGGKPYLFTLVSSVPTPGSVGHYARIVQENATLRRLIDASQQISDLAFALPDDVEEAVDQSEDLIYQVTNRRVSEDLAHLKDLLTENMEMVEKLYERGSAITGVATGFSDLDDLTAGLQPSNLIIVAARPSMGQAPAQDTPIAPPQRRPRGTGRAGSAVAGAAGRGPGTARGSTARRPLRAGVLARVGARRQGRDGHAQVGPVAFRLGVPAGGIPPRGSRSLAPEGTPEDPGAVPAR